jgi:hypothetical protein
MEARGRATGSTDYSPGSIMKIGAPASILPGTVVVLGVLTVSVKRAVVPRPEARRYLVSGER